MDLGFHYLRTLLFPPHVTELLFHWGYTPIEKKNKLWSSPVLGIFFKSGGWDVLQRGWKSLESSKTVFMTHG